MADGVKASFGRKEVGKSLIYLELQYDAAYLPSINVFAQFHIHLNKMGKLGIY